MGRKAPGNPQNLIPLNRRSPEEQFAIKSAGGKASGVVRRDKKTMREWAKILGEETLSDASSGDQMSRFGIAVLQQFQKAMKGDTKAIEFLAKLSGQLSDQPQIAVFGQDIQLKFDE